MCMLYINNSYMMRLTPFSNMFENKIRYLTWGAETLGAEWEQQSSSLPVIGYIFSESLLPRAFRVKIIKINFLKHYDYMYSVNRTWCRTLRPSIPLPATTRNYWRLRSWEIIKWSRGNNAPGNIHHLFSLPAWETTCFLCILASTFLEWYFTQLSFSKLWNAANNIIIFVLFMKHDKINIFLVNKNCTLYYLFPYHIWSEAVIRYNS